MIKALWRIILGKVSADIVARVIMIRFRDYLLEITPKHKSEVHVFNILNKNLLIVRDTNEEDSVRISMIDIMGKALPGYLDKSFTDEYGSTVEVGDRTYLINSTRSLFSTVKLLYTELVEDQVDCSSLFRTCWVNKIHEILSKEQECGKISKLIYKTNIPDIHVFSWFKYPTWKFSIGNYMVKVVLRPVYDVLYEKPTIDIEVRDGDVLKVIDSVSIVFPDHINIAKYLNKFI